MILWAKYKTKTRQTKPKS